MCVINRSVAQLINRHIDSTILYAQLVKSALKDDESKKKHK